MIHGVDLDPLAFRPCVDLVPMPHRNIPMVNVLPHSWAPVVNIAWEIAAFLVPSKESFMRAVPRLRFHFEDLLIICVNIRRTDGGHDDEGQPHVESAEKIGLNIVPAKKLIKEKLEYGLKYPPIERRLNPNLNAVRK